MPVIISEILIKKRARSIRVTCIHSVDLWGRVPQFPPWQTTAPLWLKFKMKWCAFGLVLLAVVFAGKVYNCTTVGVGYFNLTIGHQSDNFNYFLMLDRPLVLLTTKNCWPLGKYLRCLETCPCRNSVTTTVCFSERQPTTKWSPVSESVFVALSDGTNYFAPHGTITWLIEPIPKANQRALCWWLLRLPWRKKSDTPFY